MQFNSYLFLVFLCVLYLAYRVLATRGQNILLLVASYIFYGWWDVRFICLLMLSTVTNYSLGLIIDKGEISKRERIYQSILVIGLSCLFVVVQWKHLEPGRGYLPLDWRQLVSWRQGWVILASACAALLFASWCYPRLTALEEEKRRRICLSLGVAANLSILAFFKYFDFFVDNIASALSSLGVHAGTSGLHLIVPVGVSFYTFQNLSYVIDVYRKGVKPAEHFLDFTLFVAFFPKLVAGPIERAARILPQIYGERKITRERSWEGFHLLAYGLFKKVVIADGMSIVVDQVYGSGQASWIQVVLGTLLFTIQIYCDFSGYTDIARGTASLLGFDLMLNFNFPYFSRNPREFWSRWHISLSTWLRDYLYIPLGGNRFGEYKTYRNLMMTMVLGGFWHGAAWNYGVWGFYHGILLCLHRLSQKFIEIKSNISFLNFLKIGFFFVLTCYGWLLFRSPSLERIGQFTSILILDFGNLATGILKPSAAVLLGLPIFIVIEFIEYRSEAKHFYEVLPVSVWTAFYAFIIVSFLLSTANETNQFIYLNF